MCRLWGRHDRRFQRGDMTMTIERFEDLARVFRENRLDRRRLMQTAAALGLSASAAGGTLSRIEPVEAAAQESDLKLVTISHQQEPSWNRAFNPLLDQNSSRWPTQ